MEFDSIALKLSEFATKALENAPDDDITERAKIERQLRRQSRRHMRVVDALKKNHLHEVDEEDLYKYLVDYPNMAAFHARYRWKRLLMEDSGISRNDLVKKLNKRRSSDDSSNTKKRSKILEEKSSKLREMVENIEKNTQTVRDMLENEISMNDEKNSSKSLDSFQQNIGNTWKNESINNRKVLNQNQNSTSSLCMALKDVDAADKKHEISQSKPLSLFVENEDNSETENIVTICKSDDVTTQAYSEHSRIDTVDNVHSNGVLSNDIAHVAVKDMEPNKGECHLDRSIDIELNNKTKLIDKASSTAHKSGLLSRERNLNTENVIQGQQQKMTHISSNLNRVDKDYEALSHTAKIDGGYCSYEKNRSLQDHLKENDGTVSASAPSSEERAKNNRALPSGNLKVNTLYKEWKYGHESNGYNRKKGYREGILHNNHRRLKNTKIPKSLKKIDDVVQKYSLEDS
ncbi:uncharacterized protein RNJ42_00688 [Nakaseomyces bracarensis]|uniref:uncharacterized protein n=1 Tax=Nakaseomyces bracarensis TaxID=273131 RepID=UPI0038724450